ncbi:MAG TPA: hypothetical protein VFD43_06545 [Planctomycetota bacterium]|nr:hypothetical protein [Planctomycetota bacterium]
MHDLLIALPPERFATLYRSLDPPLARALDGAIAQVLHARVQSVAKAPEGLRVKALRTWIARQKDDAVAGDLLRGYFLGARKALVIQFLDATGTAHEDGQVTEEGQPDAAKVADAVKSLLNDHDRDDVRLYLQIAARQWPGIPAVAEALAGLPAPV